MQTYSYTVRHRNGWGTGFGPRPTACHACGAPLGESFGACHEEPIASHPSAPALRKGETLARAEARCFGCCAASEREAMIRNGKGCLYLEADRLTDWGGLLSFPTLGRRYSRHGGGFGCPRVDTWFYGPDGLLWYGVCRGDMTLTRVRRLKRQPR